MSRIIRGETVILRPHRLADASHYVRWFKDKTVTRFTATENISLSEEKKWLQEVLKKKEGYYLAVDYKDGRHIGTTSLEVDKQNPRALEFGIIIGDKNYWDKGVGTEVLKLMLKLAFSQKKAARVYLNVFSGNKRAIKVYQRVGFRLEGKRRKHIFKRGKLEDDYLMGILREDWQKKNKK